ncbi:LPS export ABC transporter periplasmic protein LptC [Paucidesulfovibrio longus]|uniref:LPS export ABC transporter periplasmic protein LptC n=1 Tax=Paucidesulfovibrio longus TaxID=889 RepID=UPI0003B33BD1|nr:LPS export ABC transporter periplasmic protein LptC [Paucidesulfovibrio longus]
MRFRVLLAWIMVFGFGVLIGVALFHKDEEPVQQIKEARLEEEITPERIEKTDMDVFSADIFADDIELVQGVDGRIDWRVKAKGAEYSQTKNSVTIIAPQLSAYLGEDRNELFIRADMGEVDQRADNFRLWENVTGRYGLFAVKADEFDYIGAMEKVYLKGRVVIRRGDISISATAIEIDTKTRLLVAAGGVEALFTPESLEDVKLPGKEQ